MRATLGTLGLILLVSAGGCATFRGASARHAYIESQTQEFVFAKPAVEVWPAARQLLFEKGYEVKNTGEAGALTAESEWKHEDKRRSRYLIQVSPVDPAHCKVMFTKMEGQDGFKQNDSTRDTGMEWDLIQKVEPERATAIKADADKRGEAAKATSS
jgi:uncharacterized lipoprotein